MRVRANARCFLALWIGLGVGADAAWGQALPKALDPELRHRIQLKLNSLHSDSQAPGFSAGFALPQDRSFSVTAGYSELSSRVPMKPSDRLLAASIGKTFVAAIVLQLVEAGRLGLDDPIEKWFGREDWFGRLPNGGDVTVRMLMNHTSGIVRYELNPRFRADIGSRPYDRRTPEELVAYLLDQKAPFPAGKGWEYSDTNYILLGMIVEQITQTSYYELLKERLLVPLELRDIVPSDRRRIEGLVPGYSRSGRGDYYPLVRGGLFSFNPQFEWTGGGLASTPIDLARWFKALYEAKVFSKASLEEMLEGVEADLGPGSRYGLGVLILPTRLGVSYGHHGIFPGYLTRVMYFPGHRFALVLQVNTNDSSSLGRTMEELVLELAEVVVGG